MGSLVLCAAGVLVRRPDLVVLAAPLITAAIWANLWRPTQPLNVEHVLGNTTMHEGSVTTLAVHVSIEGDRLDDVAAAFVTPAWVDQQPAAGFVASHWSRETVGSLSVEIRPMRWGNYRINPALVVASSVWNGFRFVEQRQKTRVELTALPRASHFDAVAPGVRSPGLVGTHRSPRSGAGAELATIRPFQPGDRLRRIHWVETLRTGEIHVTGTFADHDRQVVLLIDAFEDLGMSEGIGERASSLDVTVRSAAAIAEHYIRSGDRVGLVSMGSRGLNRVQPSSGFAHLRRILEVLARVQPADAIRDDGRMPRGLRAGALILVFSSFTSAGARERLLKLAGRGMNVIGIDCLPADVVEGSEEPVVAIAWRIERLGREKHLRAIRTAGIAVVEWTGAGSLDQVLRAQQRRTRTRVGRS